MPDPIITLTTDFGDASPYVAAMKGVILGINSQARILDLTHAIPPQDLRHTAFFLAGAIPHFPPEVLHVVVVDPGVGTERALLHVEVNGHRLLVPDNGCWNSLAKGPNLPRVICLAEARYWRPEVSLTFHGRDILAPVAAHLSKGISPRKLGPLATDWVRLELPAARMEAYRIHGEIIFVDHFGNLISNIPGDAIRRPPDILKLGKRTLSRRCRWVPTYGAAEPGSVVALVGSNGMLEIAIAQGNAAKKLTASAGESVTIGWRQSKASRER